MRLTVLGSGDAFSGCGCNAGYLVDSRVLVDCGAPVNVLVRRVGATVDGLHLILVTHFHADHTFMLPIVLGGRAFHPGSDNELTIAGPVGTREYVERLISDGYGEGIHGMLRARLRLSYAVLQDGSDRTLLGYRVRAHAVVHSTGPSLAYTLTDADGTTIGFSGDSTRCAGLERAIDESDLFVCECTRWDGVAEGGHLSSGEVADLMRAHPDTRFVISHLNERHDLAGAIVAHDLLTLDVTRS